MKKYKQLFFKSSVAMFATIVLSACNNGNSNGTNKSKDSKQSATEQVFNLVVQQEMPTADLSLATNTISFTALNNVYEGLYRLDEKSSPQPAGAQELAKVSEDGLTYQLKLREDAKWSNGDPVVAADYVYGWQRTVDPKTAAEYAYLFEVVKNGAEVTAGKMAPSELGIQAVGDHELEITLAKTTPYFDYLLAFPAFFPQNQATVEAYGKEYAQTSDKAIYNGPFTLTEYDGSGADTQWSYTKNDQYWDQANVKLDKINVNVVKEAPTALNLFQDQQADDIILSGELAQQMANDPKLVIEKDARTVYLEFNQRKADSPYRNANLRKAISTAIDREALVSNILNDGSIVASGIIPEGMSFSPKDNQDFSKENQSLLKYKKDQARSYWEKAKKELNLTTFSVDIVADDTDSTKKIVEYIQSELEKNLAGIKVTVSTVPFSVRLDRGNRGDFEMILGGWGADYTDPSSFLDLFVTDNSYNRGRYSNRSYDKLVTAADSTDAADPEKRWQDMVAAEQILMEDMGIAPIYQKAEAHLRSEKLKGVVTHGAGARFDYKWTYISE